MQNTDQINESIAQMDDALRNQVSDGYHTFGELYECRNLLFVSMLQRHMGLQEVLNNVIGSKTLDAIKVWRAKRNADGALWEGWFLAGVFPAEGLQITFHLPIKYWDLLDGAETHDINPYYDGHTSKDVLSRLNDLITST